MAEKTDAEKAREQIEFYLSSSNLPFDKHLYALSASSPVNGMGTGFVSLAHLCSFKRMSPYVTSLGLTKIREALSASDSLVVDDVDGEAKVRRREALVKVADVNERSVYVKGFPRSGAKEGSTELKEEDMKLLTEISEWTQGVVEEKVGKEGEGDKRGRGRFKGSVFVEFSNVELADAFSKLDASTLSFVPKNTYTVIDSEEAERKAAPMVVQKKKDYMREKCIEKGIQFEEIPTNVKPSHGVFNAFWVEENGGIEAYLEKEKERSEKGKGKGKGKDSKKRKAEDEEPEEETEEKVEFEMTYEGKTWVVQQGEGGEDIIVKGYKDGEELKPTDGKFLGRKDALMGLRIISPPKEEASEATNGEGGEKKEQPRANYHGEIKDAVAPHHPIYFISFHPSTPSSTTLTGTALFKDAFATPAEATEKLSTHLSVLNNGNKVEWYEVTEEQAGEFHHTNGVQMATRKLESAKRVAEKAKRAGRGRGRGRGGRGRGGKKQRTK
ncbi:hypothetical protein BT69DRAFT_413261 [Atractiella rhizophila]|nr:hypothetical protein BT69DRAFT_413261 [Atractiella rhizophila]